LVTIPYEADRHWSRSVAKEPHGVDQNVVALVGLVSSDRDKLRDRPLPAGSRRADKCLVRQLHTRVVRHGYKWTWGIASLKVVASYIGGRHGATALASHPVLGEATR
jgi:hypothetical protein